MHEIEKLPFEQSFDVQMKIIFSYLTPAQFAGYRERYEMECERNGWPPPPWRSPLNECNEKEHTS